VCAAGTGLGKAGVLLLALPGQCGCVRVGVSSMHAVTLRQCMLPAESHCDCLRSSTVCSVCQPLSLMASQLRTPSRYDQQLTQTGGICCYIISCKSDAALAPGPAAAAATESSEHRSLLLRKPLPSGESGIAAGTEAPQMHSVAQAATIRRPAHHQGCSTLLHCPEVVLRTCIRRHLALRTCIRRHL
jgi:hypothetical protein